jgi:hypothetical protein
MNYVGSRGFNTSQNTSQNQAQIASTTNPVNCGYDGNLADCITTNTSANANLRTRILGEGVTALANAAFTGGTKYHALQVTLRKRISHGVTFSANYTFAKAEYNGLTLNDQTLPATWSKQTFDRTQRVAFNGTYNFPSPKSFGVLNKPFEGWMLGVVGIVQTGNPLTVTDSRNGSVYGSPTTSTALLCPGANPHALQNTNGGDRDRLLNWIDQSLIYGTPTSACGTTIPVSPLASSGTATGFGNVGPDVVIGPGQFNMDMALTKNTKVGGINENGMVQFRMEMYNMWNHAQFGNPGVAANSSSAFGKITSTVVSPRMIQFALKYMF